MHEFSLVQGILDSVTPVARGNGAERVTAIVLDIGVMTQVVDECMSFAFDALTEDDPLYAGAQLTMNFIEPESRCLDCGASFAHDRFHRTCPECGSGATVIERGKEMRIASIEVETPE